MGWWTCKRAAAGSEQLIVSMEVGDHVVALSSSGAAIAIAWNGREVLLESDWRPGQTIFHATLNGAAVTVQVAQRGTRLHLSWRGAETHITVRSPRAAELAARIPKRDAADLSRFLLSPMPVAGLFKSRSRPCT